MAEEWLEKAFNRQPDAEISAHYGEYCGIFREKKMQCKLENGFQ